MSDYKLQGTTFRKAPQGAVTARNRFTDTNHWPAMPSGGCCFIQSCQKAVQKWRLCPCSAHNLHIPAQPARTDKP